MFGFKKSRVESPESRGTTPGPGDSRLSTLNSRRSASGTVPIFAERKWDCPLPARRAITLIELLVVVTILMTLAVVAIPRMRPMMETRHLREAARSINVFLSQARIRAIQTRRPCGVLFQRAVDRNQPNACAVLRQVEIPPPYAGNIAGAHVIVQDWTINPNSGALHVPGYYVLKVAVDTNDWSDRLVRRGDLVQLNNQGPLLEIFNDTADTPDPSDPVDDFPVDANGYIEFSAGADSPPPADGWADDYVLSLHLELPRATTMPWPPVDTDDYPAVKVADTAVTEWSGPVSFKVFRQPSDDASSGLTSAFGSVAPSLQLPRGVVVDLRYSGTGNFSADPLDPSIVSDVFRAADVTPPPDPSSVIVMFGPDGSLDGVYYQGTPEPVIEPVFLLIGRWERAIDVGAEDGLENWQDITNLWLAVSPNTGMVTVAQVHGNDYDAALNLTTPTDIAESRRYAREAQFSMGGR